MSYFENAYEKVRLKISSAIDEPGLRRAQVGAIHAVASFFSLPQHFPGIVVMPTGSGKTAVIFLSAIFLRAKRVLILTPSQLVRSQISEEAASMKVLKKALVLPSDFEQPVVREVKSRLGSDADWMALDTADVVVATPQCVSPGIEGVSKPPDGLFDLIVMDEAHHSEAPRWVDITEHFKGVNRLFFTATPFRRDRKELKGKMIFSYPLRLAHQDKIFGDIKFIPVEPKNSENHDVIVAQTAEATMKADRTEGFDHRLMVRTDSKKRADDLAKIYNDNTSLKLEVIHSSHTIQSVRKKLSKLKDGEIDGIICVAMMGEGFDFPQLKVAAIHAPHKSLAVTLQFIGRFARTSGNRLGGAKFIAVPQDIQAETNELYRESAAWQEIVSNLSASRIEREIQVKEVAGTFTPVEIADTDIADVVLTDFKPYFHVKIYQIDHNPDLAVLPDFPTDISVLRHELSDEHTSSIILVKQVTRPRWSDLDQFSRVEYDLMVLYYNEASKLLFINSSRRTLQFYDYFEKHYGKGTATLLAGPRINRVLSDIQNPDFFSVGLRNTVQNSNTESYQTKTGPSAQNAISHADGLLYQRGHLFGRGAEASGKLVTIGYSSSSKVWSNYTARVGELIGWCQALVVKLQTKGPVLTGTRLDSLDIGEEVTALPEGVLGVGWHSNVFKDFPRLEIIQNGVITQGQLLDLDLKLQPSTVADRWNVRIDHISLLKPTDLEFSFENGRPLFAWADKQEAGIYVVRNDEEIELTKYLNHYPLAFYLDDFSCLDGSTLHRNKHIAMMEPTSLRSLPWNKSGINIELEFPQAGVNFHNPTSIQCLIGMDLITSKSEIVFYDHGSGEMADFLTLELSADNAVIVGLYHCKASGAPTPGDRVSDAYEVCGQVVKCLIWLKNRQLLRQRIMDRQHATGGKSRLIKGSRTDLLNILADEPAKKLEFEIYLVQPGISVAQVSEKMANIMGAASDYVQRASGAKMYLVGSP